MLSILSLSGECIIIQLIMVNKPGFFLISKNKISVTYTVSQSLSNKWSHHSWNSAKCICDSKEDASIAKLIRENED